MKKSIFKMTHNEDELVEILLENIENIENIKKVCCAICLDEKSDEIIKKYHRIHTCTDSIICDSCLLEFNSRMVKTCPICKLPLTVNTKTKLGISRKGLLITSIILSVIIKIIFECAITPIILNSKISQTHDQLNKSYMAVLIISNGLINYGAILLVGIIFEYLHEKYLKVWLISLLALLFYHVIVLVIIYNIFSHDQNVFKHYVLYFNVPVYGGLYFIVICTLIKYVFGNCKKFCLDNWFETKIKHFYIESIEIA
jgi:hypothetical protein